MSWTWMWSYRMKCCRSDYSINSFIDSINYPATINQSKNSSTSIRTIVTVAITIKNWKNYGIKNNSLDNWYDNEKIRSLIKKMTAIGSASGQSGRRAVDSVGRGGSGRSIRGVGLAIGRRLNGLLGRFLYIWSRIPVTGLQFVAR